MGLFDGNAHYLYIVRAELSDEKWEEEFNRWYDQHHVPGLLAVPGFISATRFSQLGPPRRYLAVYEIEGPEVFQEPQYLEVTGWGEWEPLIHDWRAVVYEQVETRGGGMTKVFPEDER